MCIALSEQRLRQTVAHGAQQRTGDVDGARILVEGEGLGAVQAEHEAEALLEALGLAVEGRRVGRQLPRSQQPRCQPHLRLAHQPLHSRCLCLLMQFSFIFTVIFGG